MESLGLNQLATALTQEQQHQRTASSCRDDDRKGHDHDTKFRPKDAQIQEMKGTVIGNLRACSSVTGPGSGENRY